MNKITHTFPPIIDSNSKMLFLGSFPSKISREQNFYYANPTNRFWKILSNVFNENFVDSNIEEKTMLLKKHNIALYDVFSTIQMKKESSLDSNILKIEFNDIPFLIKNTQIKYIFITSKKAYNDFIKHFSFWIKESNIEIINLSSPSSANRSKFKTDDTLIEEWKKIINKYIEV